MSRFQSRQLVVNEYAGMHEAAMNIQNMQETLLKFVQNKA